VGHFELIGVMLQIKTLAGKLLKPRSNSILWVGIAF